MTVPPARQSLTMSLLSRVIPGVGRVHAQKEPFAAAWRAANAEAALQNAPLWVALGDSMSQGIGSQSIAGSWVSQLHVRLTDAGQTFRLINLSVTGARVADVVESQLPAMIALGASPELITVLIGANDMLRKSRRAVAIPYFQQMLDQLEQLHAPTTVVANLPRRSLEATQINAMVDDAAATGAVRVVDTRGPASLSQLRGSLAEDFFHPNERGYASIADGFADALGLPPRAA